MVPARPHAHLEERLLSGPEHRQCTAVGEKTPSPVAKLCTRGADRFGQGEQIGGKKALQEAAAMIAPRRLNFYARLPASYEATRRIYRLYGKPENVFGSIGIKGPLEGRYDYGFASGY